MGGVKRVSEADLVIVDLDDLFILRAEVSQAGIELVE